MEMPVLPAEEVPLPFEDGVSAVFQPIVALRGDQAAPVALEALARGPAGSAFEQPREMFAVARAHGQVAHLDRLCIAAQLAAARTAPDGIAIFLNVHPQTVQLDTGFPAFLLATASRHGIAPARLTLEIVDHARMDGRDADLLEPLRLLRALGVGVAVDDVAGIMAARRACSLMPHYFKVAAELVRDARYSVWSRDVLRAVVEQAERAGAQVIAEGVEGERDVLLARDAGIVLMQGFLLGAPQASAARAAAARAM